MKELFALELGYRESAESRPAALMDLRDRGMSAPLLAVGDGALVLWAACSRPQDIRRARTVGAECAVQTAEGAAS